MTQSDTEVTLTVNPAGHPVLGIAGLIIDMFNQIGVPHAD